MKFVIFHGAFGSPQGNWYPELTEKLTTLGQTVIAPQFPIDSWDEVTKNGLKIAVKNQSLETWFKTFEKEVLPYISKKEKLCFIGHSLGPLFILHVVQKYNLQLDCAIFVSPFLDKLNSLWQFDHVNQSFYKTDFDFDRLKKNIPISYVLYSDNDPYVSKNHALLFSHILDSSFIFVRKAGHMNSEVNLNEFPLVFDLCNTRLDLSIYQKYLIHRQEKTVLDYIRNKYKKIVHIKPTEMFDEGVFHFSHLKRGGFCTFLSGYKDWDPKGKYYEDGRKIAKNVQFIRTFLIEKISDLKRKNLLEHIRLDFESGIQIYLCMFDLIKDKVREPDFGIWDGEYLCVIHYDKGRGMNDIVLNSKHGDLSIADNWKKIILDKAEKVTNFEHDINSFIKTHST